MKKIIIMNNIVDEETFINEVVNEMPAVCSAKFEVIDMENCILIDDNDVSLTAAKRFLNSNNVRYIIE